MFPYRLLYNVNHIEDTLEFILKGYTKTMIKKDREYRDYKEYMENREDREEKEGMAGMLKYIIGICLAGLALMLILLLTGAFGSSGRHKSETTVTPGPSETPYEKEEDTLIGIVKDMDTKEQVFKLMIPATGVEQIFSYDGTTRFFSRYDQPVKATGITYGEIVEITFDVATSKLKTCDITEKAWEYKEIDRWTLNKEENTIVIGSKTYQFSDMLYAFDSEGEIDTNSISSKDQVTVKGMGGQVYSIIVTKGHGMVTLTGYDAFLDGTIEVGYDIITTITENMVLTLREGDYKVTVTKNGLSATKYITLMAGENYQLDFSEYKPVEVKTGKCYFDITPTGADLYINNTLCDYSKPIELKYGEYEIRVECTGYQTYSKTLKVEKEKEILTITLVDEKKSSVTATPIPSVDSDYEDGSSYPNSTPGSTRTPTSAPSTTVTPSSTGTVTSSKNKITISSPTGAFVYLNDVYKGTIPVTFDKVIGENMRLTLMMTGKDFKTYNVTVKDDGFDVSWAFDQWWE